MALHKDDPTSLGGYRIVDRLGAGGMGVVYRAVSGSGRELAVKVVHAQYAEDAVFRARFRQEIEAVRKVSGAFTAPVVDADPEAARPWMATQYVPAPSLAARIRDEGPLRRTELRRLALGLVEALREIHRAGVVHRDLKPGNVLMAEDGPRVIDFGISRATENQTLTETGHMIGTPPFMSPEQLADARTVGPPSDVFSLGALLTFAATGRGPFDAHSPYLTAYRVMNEQPDLTRLPAPLRTVVAHCLAKPPEERPEPDALLEQFAAALPEPHPDDGATMTLRLPAPTPAPALEAPVAPVASVAPAGRTSRPRTTPVVVGLLCVLVVALTAYLVNGPLKGGGATKTGVSGSGESRWGTLPEGWKPWRATVYDSAATGVVRAPDEADSASQGGSPSCALSDGALYCGGPATLPTRVDARTGKTLWRADSVPPGVPAERYGSLVVAARDSMVLVEQVVSNAAGNDQTTSLVGLATDSGRPRWTRTLDMAGGASFDPTLIGDLLLLPAGGARVSAHSPIDGTERWTAALPADHDCNLHDVEGRPYAACFDRDVDGGDGSRLVVVAVDPTDGSTRTVTSVPFDGVYLGTADGQLVFAGFHERERSYKEQAFTQLVLIDPVTGSRRTAQLEGEPRGEPALAHGVLCFASTSGRVTAMSPETGERLWRTATTVDQPDRPVVDGRGETVYTASASGRVAALDIGDGTLLWESFPRAERVGDGNGYSGNDSANIYFDQGALVVSTPDGTLFSLDPANPRRGASE
ncbi:PQQ-binding-like beta-propeller repeat protein [Streptomyces sp. NPDC006172]|uniref:serine/threonine-protein kinase n=1 Tax=Streptomyces sp. NPDC006172 TaxID=3154470 RepID=UPI0033E2928C